MTLSITILCCYAEFHYEECRILFTIMLSVIMLNVILLSVIMLNVIVLSVVMINAAMLSVMAPHKNLPKSFLVFLPNFLAIPRIIICGTRGIIYAPSEKSVSYKI
jgi:hypothetical protein